MSNFFNKILYGGGVIFDLTKYIILAVVVIIVINKFWLSPFITDGASMEPNIHDKELVLLNVSKYHGANPQRGDVVVVRYPGDPNNRKYVKRVIGLPGEKLEIKDGLVYINGKKLEEYYITIDVLTVPDKSVQIEANKYFLMGDNRSFSNDSRYFGSVEKRFIIGQATTIIFPRFRPVPTLKY